MNHKKMFYTIYINYFVSSQDRRAKTDLSGIGPADSLSLFSFSKSNGVANSLLSI